jgi:hypothetical protein
MRQFKWNWNWSWSGLLFGDILGKVLQIAIGVTITDTWIVIQSILSMVWLSVWLLIPNGIEWYRVQKYNRDHHRDIKPITNYKKGIDEWKKNNLPEKN